MAGGVGSLVIRVDDRVVLLELGSNGESLCVYSNQRWFWVPGEVDVNRSPDLYTEIQDMEEWR